MPNRCEVHKYKRIVLSERTGTEVFKCVNCPRFLKRELAVGEKSTCWQCGDELTLTMENTQYAKPTHVECRGKKIMVAGEKILIPPSLNKALEKEEKDDIDEFLDTLGI